MTNSQTGGIEYEYTFCKVPVESLSKFNRTVQHALNKDFTVVDNAMKTLINREKDNPDVEKTCASLDKIITKLRGVKRKLEEAEADCDTQLVAYKQRLCHLRDLTPMTPATTRIDDLQTAQAKRVQRQLVDYLLRFGYNKTADAIASRYNLQALTDVAVFKTAQPIVNSLRKHSCTETLQWCKENQLRLKKLKSTFEFQIRLQEFLLLIQSKKKLEAVQYCHKWLSPHGEQQIEVLKPAMAALTMYNMKPEKYQHLFGDERWEELIQLFKKEVLLVTQLGAQPPLHALLQAGMLALKTPQAHEEGQHNVDDPMCSEQFQQLSAHLPKTNRKNSTLVCRLSGVIMDDENNAPLVLPNGQVYSFQALTKHCAADGKIQCPATGEVFEWKQLHKVYIM